ncbi:MAG: HtaA domain-containing protein [Yaniella sp.]|uniref:HtaA domain-containing protein n=1 Tax=Yaniella sp. TaxID=2773929 RepID=UPI0026471639|nr:HtaA domain-containing protein [Yaniella sp.]MDN5730656.1 HtaA domain-containing protein [Yaniella sp.]MDN5742491.1 HtaA domain-containing protein [Yaniella sp.]MDN5816187.1 HtaA domain-containing protein [Yaniella sp.]MDN5817663.1 HtaA domain-containing protein [Yaniella sp.]MDN5837198.1 HtaA domain-containing protein [Yaniella sp.]
MRIPNVTARLSKALLPVTLGAALLAAPSIAFADQTTEAETAEAGLCQITNATLDWGVKESFRAYISGSIANGSWDTSEGASYDTPHFTWSDGSGAYDPATETGDITFEGTVQFTGHDGVLDLTIANPTFEFEGDGEAALLLDTISNDMDGDVAVDADQQWVGEISLDEDISPDDGSVQLTDLQTTLTNSGAAAFGGFYEAGEALDPIALSFDMADCDSATATTDEPDVPENAEDVVQPEPTIIPAPQLPWLPISLGGLALLVIGFTIGFFVGGRKPQRTRQRQHGSDEFDEMMGNN